MKEYPQEQYLRDVKIMSLYEGTNGIQSMDLLGRKMRINNGAPFNAFMTEIEGFCGKNGSQEGIERQIIDSIDKVLDYIYTSEKVTLRG